MQYASLGSSGNNFLFVCSLNVGGHSEQENTLNQLLVEMDGRLSGAWPGLSEWGFQ